MRRGLDPPFVCILFLRANYHYDSNIRLIQKLRKPYNISNVWMHNHFVVSFRVASVLVMTACEDVRWSLDLKKVVFMKRHNTQQGSNRVVLVSCAHHTSESAMGESKFKHVSSVLNRLIRSVRVDSTNHRLHLSRLVRSLQSRMQN